jgi:dynein heavy chain
MQTTARKNDWALDKTVLVTEVTKKSFQDIDGPSREGAYVHGLFVEGARWDEKLGMLVESNPKKLTTPLPVRI